MIEIRLEPSLADCIETIAKREYERVLGILLKEDREDRQLEEELELLRVFLESADFGQLRSLSEDLLLDGRRVEFIVRSTDKPPGYEIEVKDHRGA